ncbi:MAG: M1 family metallopeptidase [Pyrinomonadaceae bacterium]
MMMRRPLLLAWMASAILFFVGTPAAAQTAVRFDRPRTFDVERYVIRLRFDRAKRTVFGDTTVTLAPIDRPLRTVELDAVGMTFQSVELGPPAASKRLAAKSAGGKVAVKLDRAYRPGETIALRFVYSTRPQKGVFFVPALIEDGKEVRSEQIWTQNQPEDARHWFPSFDFPSDKATTELFINARKDETVVSNGRELEPIAEADGSVTRHFEMDVPHSTYLVSFVVGRYVRQEGTSRGVPLGYYVYPGREAIVPRAFGSTPRMIEAFEDATGVKFPFNKYDQTIVGGFENLSGMENITATTLSDRDVFFAELDLGRATVEDLVSHELAHSWFGNMVTCRNWSELWLNEGFATFMEAVSRERLYGRDSYIRKLRSDVAQYLADDAIAKRRHALVNLTARPDDSLFDATTYQKGAAVIHMLREEVGDEAFWKAVNAYLQKFRFGNVVTSDLQAAMEAAAGRKLDWFFKQWVYSTGYPKLEYDHEFNRADGTLRIRVRQTQTAAGVAPEFFRLPLEIEVATASGHKLVPLMMNARTAEIIVRVGGEPTAVRIDPQEKLILKSVNVQKAAQK